MKAAIIAEFRKLISTRIWWILLIVMVLYLGFTCAVLATSLTYTSNDANRAMMPQGVEVVKAIYSTINGVGYVFPLIVGSLLMTTEFRYKTITQSLLVEPRRTVFLVAKIIATIPVGLIYGVVAAITVVAAAAPVLIWQDYGTFLDDPAALKVLGWGIVVVAIWALMGVTLGSMIPNQVAAIVTILVVTQFIEPIARISLTSFDATEQVSKLLPAAAADAVMGASFFSTALGSSSELLSRPVGLLVLIGYATLFAVIARFTTLRRDPA